MLENWSTVYDLEKIINDIFILHKNNNNKKFSTNILISGKSGIGKTQILDQICKKNNLKLKVVQAYQYGEFITGLPLVNSDITKFTKAEWVQEVLDENPDVIMFDDAHLIRSEYLNHFYETLTFRIFQSTQLNKNTIFVLIGNWGIDAAFFNDIPLPIMSRMNYIFKFEPDLNKWIEWGLNNNIDKRIINYLSYFKDEFIINSDVNEVVISPRNWEYFSEALKNGLQLDYFDTCLGVKIGNKFKDFLLVLDKSLDELLTLAKDKNLKESEKIAIIVALGNYDNAYKNKSITDYISSLNDDRIVLWITIISQKYKMEDNYKEILEFKKYIQKQFPSIYEVYNK